MKFDVAVIGALLGVTLVGAVILTLAGDQVPALLADATTFLLGALVGAAGLSPMRRKATQ